MPICCWSSTIGGSTEGRHRDRFSAHAGTESARSSPSTASRRPYASLAPGARVRLRFANLANARIMFVGLEKRSAFVVAVDSQPCDAFEPVRRTIPVAPGARFELLFDLPRTEGATAS